MNIRFENLFRTFSPIIEMLKDEGLHFFIVGGCIKDFFRVRKNNDIDLIFKSEKDIIKALEFFALNGATIILNNDKVIKLNYHDKVYDIIKMVYQTPTQIIESFDFTITQFVIDSLYTFYYTEEAFQDLSKRQLMLNALPFPESTMLRVNKYLNSGFKICNEELTKIIFAIRDKNKNKDDLASLFETSIFNKVTQRKYTSKLFDAYEFEYVETNNDKSVAHITIDDLEDFGFNIVISTLNNTYSLSDESNNDNSAPYEFFGID